MSFGNDSTRDSGASGKRPKPPKGKEPTRLDQCADGDVVEVRIAVKVFRWVKHDGSVWCRPVVDGIELEPMQLDGDTEVQR